MDVDEVLHHEEDSHYSTTAVLKAFPQGNNRNSGKEEYASNCDQ